MAAIAQRAGVTQMTFFRHFPSKDSVLVADAYDPVIAQAISGQPAHLPPLAATIEAISDRWKAVPPRERGEVRARLRIVSRTPSLTGALARSNATTEAAIAGALVRRGVSTSDARIAAAAAMAALTAALLEWASGDDPDLGTAIDAARRVLRGDSP